MTTVAVLVLVVAALSRHRWRRRRDHVPRLLRGVQRMQRQHGVLCGCEACIENYAQQHGRTQRLIAAGNHGKRPCAAWCPVCEIKRAHVAQLEKLQ